MRLVRKFRNLLLGLSLLALSICVYKPDLLHSYPKLQQQAIWLRARLTPKHVNLASGLDVTGRVLGSTVELVKKTPLKSQFKNVPEQIVVEDLVEQLYQEVKNLPEQQARKIALGYCQQLLEATPSPTVSMSSNAL